MFCVRSHLANPNQVFLVLSPRCFVTRWFEFPTPPQVGCPLDECRLATRGQIVADWLPRPLKNVVQKRRSLREKRLRPARASRREKIPQKCRASYFMRRLPACVLLRPVSGARFGHLDKGGDSLQDGKESSCLPDAGLERNGMIL